MILMRFGWYLGYDTSFQMSGFLEIIRPQGREVHPNFYNDVWFGCCMGSPFGGTCILIRGCPVVSLSASELFRVMNSTTHLECTYWRSDLCL